MPRLLLLAACVLLAAPAFAQTAHVQRAEQHLSAHAKDYALPTSGLADARVVHEFTSPSTGLTHVYFRQTLGGIDVRVGNITVTLNRNGQVGHAAGSFLPDEMLATARAAGPGLDAEGAALAAAAHLGLTPTSALTVTQARAEDGRTMLAEGGIAREPIAAELVYELVDGALVLAWAVDLFEVEREHFWHLRVDAQTGAFLGKDDHIVHCSFGDPEGHAAGHHDHGFGHGFETTASAVDLAAAPAADWHPPMALTAGAAQRTGIQGGTYRVFPIGVESPIHGERVLVADPADPEASPEGWHDDGNATYTISRGNNVYAYVDANNTNSPSGTDAIPEGGLALQFDFPIDFTQEPSTYRFAAVTNLFYWNNVLHDVLHYYGFDEASGNFQVTNYTGQGLGNDPVDAEAQDGGGTNNANFLTRPDGQRARMQMYLWNTATPRIDGDFDNGIIAHEYGHGWSIRLTGGGSQTTCLQNQEQGGEGWSDYLGLILTMQPGDTAAQRRGIGTFALNQPTTGNGIRPAPYTTDMSINSFTYGNLPQMAVPHGVGFVWATMLWDMTWNIIDMHGWDPDFYNGTGGNNIALRLVSEAMKLQPCRPGFVDARDAILAADELLYDGAHRVAIWNAFARRGLGYSASQGSSENSNDGIEAFDLPPGIARAFSFDANPDPVAAGEFVTYELTFLNGEALDPVSGVEMTVELPEGLVYVPGSASDGGSFDPEARTLSFPGSEVDTGAEITRTFIALADLEGGSTILFEDDMEDGDDAWTVETTVSSLEWSQVTSQSDSGTTSWYGRNHNARSDQRLILDETVTPTAGTTLRFSHRFDFETRWDGGVVELQAAAGGSWIDLGSAMTQNGYTETLRSSTNPLASRPAFTGGSGGWITTEVDLSAYAGTEVRIRFRVGTDGSVGFPNYDGWYVDDVLFIDEVTAVASACSVNDDDEEFCATRRSLILDPMEGSPVLDLDTAPIAMMLGADEVATLTLDLANTGERDLAVALGSEAVWLSGPLGVQTIEVDGSGTIELTFDTNGLDSGTYETELVVLSNDREAPVTTIAVELLIQGVSTEDDATLANGYALGSAYPNPLRERAEVTLQVAHSQRVTVALYDVMGREVARLHDGDLASGSTHRLAIDANGLASGVYLLRVQGEAFAETQRLTVVR